MGVLLEVRYCYAIRPIKRRPLKHALSGRKLCQGVMNNALLAKTNY